MTAYRLLPLLVVLAWGLITPAPAWWDPAYVVDISTANLYGITAAFRAERPGVDKVALIAERRIAADRAVALAAAGGFPWLDGPFGLFLVDTSSGAAARTLSVFDSASPNNLMPGYEARTGVYEVRSNSCKFYPMPVPDKEVLKRYRPDRAKDGCGINDKLGPFRKLGDRMWFCKNFYGGEGDCGVGAAGFFDTKAKVFEIFYSSITAPWSCSAILAEENTVWLGLEHSGEGWGKAGGLAALNPATGEVKIYAIHRSGDRLLLVTGEGIYVLSAKGETSFIGPDVDEAGDYKLQWE